MAIPSDIPVRRIPAKQPAIVAVDAEGTLAIRDDVPVIELERDAVIVETTALALNPVDTKMMHGFAVPGAILGFDFAGYIVAIGPDVTQPFKIGDRVCASGDSMSKKRPSGGSFARFTDCPASLVIKLPDGMPFTAAAGLRTSLMAAGMALFYSMRLPATLDTPAEKPFFVLVNGGASSSGTMAIQLLRRCNARPITTCSPHSFDLVASYGAERAFDYNSPTCARDIRAYTGNNLAYAVDCITTSATMRLCYDALGRAGGRYAALDPFPRDDGVAKSRRVVKPDWILATDCTGRSSSWPAPYGDEGEGEGEGGRGGSLAEARRWGDEFVPMAQRAVEEGAVRTHPTRICKGGLEGILEGIDLIRRGEVKGEKLVYPVHWD